MTALTAQDMDIIRDPADFSSEKFDLWDNVIYLAFGKGDLELSRWIRTECNDLFIWDHKCCCYIAAENGQLEMLKDLRNTSISFSLENSLYGAIKGGQLAILEWIHSIQSVFIVGGKNDLFTVASKSRVIIRVVTKLPELEQLCKLCK